MSTKADYSAEEWGLVLKAPLMAGLAVIAASPSGPLRVLREMFAVGKLVAETKTQAEGQGGLSNELLRAVVADLASPDGRAQVDVAELRGLASEQLRAARPRRLPDARLARRPESLAGGGGGASSAGW